MNGICAPNGSFLFGGGGAIPVPLCENGAAAHRPTDSTSNSTADDF